MRRRVVKIVEQRHVAIARGWRVNELLVEAGIRPYFAGGGWMVDLDRLPDLLAHLERRRIAVEIVGRRSDETVTSTLDDTLARLPVDHTSLVDPPLWDPNGGDAA